MDHEDTTRWVEPGVLYLVGTPIGNLADWSPRAQSVLQEVDLILCEDTRVTGLLCHQHQIDTPLLSFHAHNTKSRIPQILERLQSGQALALVSDRGMPALSDPGQELVDMLWQEHAGKVSVIPGPSAAVSAFVISGFPAPFTFWGFLPRAGSLRRQVLADLATSVHTSIIYEAPHHLKVTLKDLSALGEPDRPVMLGREITKRHEEFWRGTLAQLQSWEREWRGEIVLVIGPKPPVVDSRPNWEQLQQQVADLVADGMHQKEAIRRIASEMSLPKRDLYQFIVNRLHKED